MTKYPVINGANGTAIARWPAFPADHALFKCISTVVSSGTNVFIEISDIEFTSLSKFRQPASSARPGGPLPFVTGEEKKKEKWKLVRVFRLTSPNINRVSGTNVFVEMSSKNFIKLIKFRRSASSTYPRGFILLVCSGRKRKEK